MAMGGLRESGERHAAFTRSLECWGRTEIGDKQSIAEAIGETKEQGKER